MSDRPARDAFEASAARYRAPERAAAYGRRRPAREAAERRLLGRLLAALPPLPGPRPWILDAPCGRARLAPELLTRGPVLGLDRSPAMLTAARAAHPGVRLVRGDLARLPLSDQAAACTICFRFLHHLPPPAQERAVAELARVTRRALILSAFHPVSLHHALRRLACAVARRPPPRHATPPSRLDAWLRAAGFERRLIRRQGILRDLYAVLYVRTPLPRPKGPR